MDNSRYLGMWPFRTWLQIVADRAALVSTKDQKYWRGVSEELYAFYVEALNNGYDRYETNRDNTALLQYIEAKSGLPYNDVFLFCMSLHRAYLDGQIDGKYYDPIGIKSTVKEIKEQTNEPNILVKTAGTYANFVGSNMTKLAIISIAGLAGLIIIKKQVNG